jgi:hypothetical protein
VLDRGGDHGGMELGRVLLELKDRRSHTGAELGQCLARR